MKNKLTTTPNLKQEIIYIMEEIIGIINVMNHQDYNVLMRDADLEDLLRLSKEAKKLFEEWKTK
tara:strand:+ start:130 stop:321 length:192 start_codon:yes stop_codon:yes gene_type:complete